MHKSMQAAHFEMISRLGEIQFFQRTLRSLIRQMPMLSSLTRQWLLRFLAAQSFSLLLCNFSLAFGANQTSWVLSIGEVAQPIKGKHPVRYMFSSLVRHFVSTASQVKVMCILTLMLLLETLSTKVLQFSRKR